MPWSRPAHGRQRCSGRPRATATTLMMMIIIIIFEPNGTCDQFIQKSTISNVIIINYSGAISGIINYSGVYDDIEYIMSLQG